MGILKKLSQGFPWASRKSKKENKDWTSAYLRTLQSLGYGSNDSYWTSGNYKQATAESYMKGIISARCMKLRAENAANIPLVVKSLKDDSILPNHPLLQLLRRPNPKTTKNKFIQSAITYRDLSGNSYIVDSSLKQNQKPKFLWTLRPDSVTPLVENGNVVKYTYYGSDGTKIYDVDPLTGLGNIINWKTFNPLDDINGLPVITPIQRSIMLHNVSQEFNTSLLNNSGTPSGIISLASDEPEGFDPELFAKTKQMIRDEWSGKKNAGKMLALPQRLNYNKVALSVEEMQLMDSLNQNATYIAFGFGVPPALVGVVDNTFSNVEAAEEALYSRTVIPLLQELIDELNIWLAPRFGDVYIDMDISEIPALVNRRKKILEMYMDSEATTTNERREFLGLPAVDGGDTIFVDTNKVPLNVATTYINIDYETDISTEIGVDTENVTEDGEEIAPLDTGDNENPVKKP